MTKRVANGKSNGSHLELHIFDGDEPKHVVGHDDALSKCRPTM